MDDKDFFDSELVRRYSAKRLNDRFVDEMIGICKGVIADNKINHAEADFINQWLLTNRKYIDDPIVTELYRSIKTMLSDNVLDEDEHDELLEALKLFTGQITPSEARENLSTGLPLDMPAPKIDFDCASFCITGKFAYGPRSIVADVIEDLGGFYHSNLTQKTDYLVIGYFATPAWAHTSYGRKIEAALNLRSQGFPISIVSEDHWAAYAFRNGEV